MADAVGARTDHPARPVHQDLPVPLDPKAPPEIQEPLVTMDQPEAPDQQVPRATTVHRANKARLAKQAEARKLDKKATLVVQATKDNLVRLERTPIEEEPATPAAPDRPVPLVSLDTPADPARKVRLDPLVRRANPARTLNIVLAPDARRRPRKPRPRPKPKPRLNPENEFSIDLSKSIIYPNSVIAFMFLLFSFFTSVQ